MLAVAGVVSAAMVWLASGDITAVVAFIGGIIVLGGVGAALVRLKPAGRGDEVAVPDWSVTVAAIERAGEAVAIVDRANRLVCANTVYSAWFGAGVAPPNLPLDRAGLEALTRTARETWREGTGTADRLEGIDGTSAWSARAERAGRGEDYLIWRFAGLTKEDFADDLGARIGGTLGQLLSRAGIETALVGPDGLVRAAAPGFAQRAAGDGSATLAGQEFAALLRADERERIYFAREGRRGVPQTLIHVGLGDGPDGRAASADEAPSLMLLIDAGVGLGGAAEVVGSGAAPQLEALLGALPLGLAMTDRDGRFLFANAPFRRAAGIEGDGLPSFPSDLVVADDKGPLVDAVRRFGKGTPQAADMAVRLRGAADEPVSLGIAGCARVGGSGRPA